MERLVKILTIATMLILPLLFLSIAIDIFKLLFEYWYIVIGVNVIIVIGAWIYEFNKEKV